MDSFQNKNITNPCNQSGFGKVMPEYIMPSGYSKGMVPFYGPKLTQNMNGTGLDDSTHYRQKLAGFTGTDEEYRHKKETGSLFKPAEQITGFVFGSPITRPEMDRYNTWLRNGETPVEKIQVGKGIGLDYDSPGEGGFHQFTRLLPSNVSDYKRNQLENRVNVGKHVVNYPTSNPNVPKNRPSNVYTDERYPAMPLGAAITAQSGNLTITDHNSVVDRGTLTRENHTNFTGVAVSHVPKGIENTVPEHSRSRRVQIPTIDKTIGSQHGSKAGVNRQGYYVYDTHRGNTNSHVANLSGTTTGQQWHPNSFEDSQKVTRKQTTVYSHNGVITGKKQNTSRYQFEGEATGPFEGTEYFDANIQPDLKLKPIQQTTTKHRKGGSSSNNLRTSTMVVNYTRNPGNNVPDNKAEIIVGKFSYKNIRETPVKSFDIGASFHKKGITEKMMGETTIKNTRSIKSDRDTIDSNLILHNNPLSIYSENHNASIPGFFKPTKSSVYTTEHITTVWK